MSEAADTSYESHPTMRTTSPLGLALAVLLCPIGIGFLILVYWHVKNRFKKLTVNNREVIYERGVFSKRYSEIRTADIRTVDVRQSFTQRLFDGGDIALYTAGDEPELVVEGMPDPGRIRALIKAG